MQASIDSHHPVVPSGITFIKAPTGDGKTEGAILAAARYAEASGRAGWFFAMPTRATADGLFDRLQKLLPALAARSDKEQAVSLRRIHSLSGMHEHCRHDSDGGRDWLSGGRKAMLTPFGVGTIDQALMSALRTKHAPVRMLGATAGCFIVDEAHSYDWYMGELLKRLMGWMGALGTPVVVLSATIPQSLITDLAAAYQAGACSHLRRSERPTPLPPPDCGYPGWAQWTPDLDRSKQGVWTSRTTAPTRTWTLRVDMFRTDSGNAAQDMAEAAINATEDGGCVLVVRETVAKAQQTYDAVKAAVAGTDCETVLLHSRFRHRDRHRIERDLLKQLGPVGAGVSRPRRLVVVATQIVEMSLDVDFDLVVTDPAPIGAVIQRAGRSHRHLGRQRPAACATPRVMVFWPETSDGQPEYRSPVYMEHDLRRSRELLVQLSTIAIPADVPAIVDQAADGEQPDIHGEAAWLDWLADADVQKGAAKLSLIPDPSRYASRCLHNVSGPHDDDHIAPTRLGVPTILVLPVYPTSGDCWTAKSAGSPLPANPTPDQERDLHDACVPVSRYPNTTSWLDVATTEPPFRTSPNQRGRNAWRSGPLNGVLLLPCERQADGTDHASQAPDDWSVTLSAVRGLAAVQTRRAS